MAQEKNDEIGIYEELSKIKDEELGRSYFFF